jgi:ribonuclease HI
MNIAKLSVFTDGSCLNNGKKNSTGAIGVFFSDNDPDNFGQYIEDENKVTNQTTELLACIQAFRIIESKISRGLKFKILYVYTDSSYLINCMNKWYSQWIKNGWKNSKGKDVENKELIQALYALKNKHIVIFKHVRSHQDPPNDQESEEFRCWYGNYMADKLATDASRQYMEQKEAEQKIVQEQELQKVTNIDVDEDIEVKEAIVKKVKSTKKTAKKTVKQSLNV